jgi:hypothetical protein
MTKIWDKKYLLCEYATGKTGHLRMIKERRINVFSASPRENRIDPFNVHESATQLVIKIQCSKTAKTEIVEKFN